MMERIEHKLIRPWLPFDLWFETAHFGTFGPLSGRPRYDSKSLMSARAIPQSQIVLLHIASRPVLMGFGIGMVLWWFSGLLAVVGRLCMGWYRVLRWHRRLDYVDNGTSINLGLEPGFRYKEGLEDLVASTLQLEDGFLRGNKMSVSRAL